MLENYLIEVNAIDIITAKNSRPFPERLRLKLVELSATYLRQKHGKKPNQAAKREMALAIVQLIPALQLENGNGAATVLANVIIYSDLFDLILCLLFAQRT